MNRRMVPIFLLATSFLWIACGSDSSLLSPAAPPTPTATATPTRDEKGNQYTPDGWELPQPLATGEKEKSQRFGKYQDGRKVGIDVVSYNAPLDVGHQTFLEGPSRPGGQVMLIKHVAELSVGGGRVFCYVYTESPVSDEGRGQMMTTEGRVKFCDMDGDGKYELRGDDSFFPPITVPDWAK